VSRYRVGIDIGGTFTDFVLVDAQAGRIHLGKRLTTHDNYLDAVMNGFDELVAAAGITATDVEGVVHGTTLVTNTVIERKGAPTALITTEGARDVIEIGAEFRYDIYDLGIERVKPLVPRHLRLELPGRLAYDGRELRPLDLERLPSMVEALRREGITAVAVSMLHSYVNPAHEQAVGEGLKRLFPEAEVTLSSALVPEIREFERTSTAIVNAYVQPLVSRYLRDMEQQLAKRRVSGPLYLMLSGGGLASVAEAVAAPVQLIESGPAGGAIAACFYGRNAGGRSADAPDEGIGDMISFDMGGTTAKMCLINGGSPARTHNFEAARVHRFKKGSGIPLRVPVIDMIEIGAGGGSIARVDAMGLLKVGPESAGSSPGPACYGLGGKQPTVTDADLALGYLDPGFFLGGSMRLDSAAAERAIHDHIAEPLGIGITEAAAGIQEIVNENMATATRLYVAESGRDIRRYAMLAFGGAGPVHAYRLAQILGLKKLICPYAAGTASALGFLVAPLTVEQVRSYVAPLEKLDWARLQGLYADMEARAIASLQALGVKVDEIDFTRTADMRFSGQGYEIEAALPGGHLDATRSGSIRDTFIGVYKQLFERAPEGLPIEGLSWRLRATGRRPELTLDFRGANADTGAAKKGTRKVYFHHERAFMDAPVYDRYKLAPGGMLQGPAIFEERESTVVVGPGARIDIDASLNLIVHLP
jgi:N-methylhydantoinase A